ncbi:hypothetical protein [Marinifilum sp.]|uniref:hypothetical protein n=1 Tax=Marinifilum sp. TaxID=2033137 RepID=UPI003BA98831
MKALLLFIFWLVASNCVAQFKNLESISVSYLGEMITHPGIKVSADFNMKEWDKTKNSHRGSSKTITKSLLFSPALGSFYHRRYQTGVFFMPEAKLKRKNPKGKFYEIGVGLGYLRTFIPNTYKVNDAGEVSKTLAGHNYFATNYSISFGKDLSVKKNLLVAYFIKPQFIYAVPNFPNGTGYFALEIGIKYSLK